VAAVAVVVVRLRAAVHEVDEFGDALIAVRIIAAARVRQIVVPRGHTRIDYRETDAGTGEAEQILDGARADGDRRPIVVRENRAVVVHAEHARIRAELLEQPVRQFEHDAIDDVEFFRSREAAELRR
jgi:hypothetical protein